MGAGHPPALVGEYRNRRRDNLYLFTAERSAFAGMRVETRDREARIGDSETALKSAKHGAAPGFDQAGRKVPRDRRHSEMGGDRNRAKRRTREHHRYIGGGYATALGDEFGLAGVSKADRIELFFRHRTGDDPRGRARSRKAYGKFERVE